METRITPDERGYYGSFGGAFIPEMMQANVVELQERYEEIISTALLICAICSSSETGFAAQS